MTSDFLKVLVVAVGCLSLSCMNVPEPVFVNSRIQDNYPSGSTVSYLNGHFYIMGDDAADLLVLDRDLQEVERISLFPAGKGFRIDKEIKADIEASLIIPYNGRQSVLFFGSGSGPHHRDSAFLFHPANRSFDRFNLSPIYHVLRSHLNHLNIEGAATMGDDLILGIRANNTYAVNYLIVTSLELPLPKFKRKIAVKIPVEHAGISGLDYDEAADIMFITFSTEDTPDGFLDGKPGDSYLAVLPHASNHLKKPELEITSFTRLTDIDSQFLHQKIESVSLIREKKQLLLIADDDLGNTTFFTLRY